MINRKATQSGQAIVIIVIAMIGLLAITALAIDSSNAFSDRRHAQTAADNAALAGAMALTRSTDFQSAGLNYASSNGYTSNVTVTNPPGAGCNGTTPTVTLVDTSDSLSYYVLVVIRSDVNTYFGSIIGVNQVHNCVQSIARGVPAKYVPFAFGNSIAAMSCNQKWAVKSSGNSNTVTIGGGVFSNSSNPAAILINKISNLTIPADKSITAVGGVSYPAGYTATINQNDTSDQVACPLPSYWYPASYTCDYTFTNFPDKTLLTMRNGVLVYQMTAQKTYCITGSFKMPNAALYGDSVHIVLVNQGIHWNGNAEVHISSGLGASDPLNGILIYLPSTNCSSLVFNGTANSEMTGTVFAPCSDITLNGSYGGAALHSQFIGNTVDLSGASNLNIQYDRGLNGGYTQPPSVSLTK